MDNETTLTDVEAALELVSQWLIHNQCVLDDCKDSATKEILQHECGVACRLVHMLEDTIEVLAYNTSSLEEED